MKHRKTNLVLGLLFAFVIGILAAGLGAETALAKDYSIDKVAITAQVKTEGQMLVTERRTFRFDGSFNGVYWLLPIGEQKGIDTLVKVVKAGVVTDEGFTAFKEVEDGNPEGLTQVYTVETDVSDSGQQVKKVKLYNPVDSQSVTYEITYLLTGAVRAYEDTAELYWKFVSDGWGVPSRNVTCRIELPVPSELSASQAKSDILVWGHGPLDGTVDRTATGAVYETPEVGTQEYAEARMAFPVSWVSGMKPLNVKRLDTIKKEEKAWADEANAQRDKARRTVFAPVVFSAAVAVASAVALYFLASDYKKNHTPTFIAPYYHDIPGNEHPVILDYLLTDTPDQKDYTRWLSASIIRLCDMGDVSLQKLGTSDSLFSRGKPIYALENIEDEIHGNPSYTQSTSGNQIDAIDRQTHQFLLTMAKRVPALPDSHEAPTTAPYRLLFSDLDRLADHDPKSFDSALEKWKRTVDDTVLAKKFTVDIHPYKIWLNTIFTMLGFLSLFAAIGAMIMVEGTSLQQTLVPIGLVCAAAQIVMLYLLFRQRRTYRDFSREGLDLVAKTRALKKWLCEFTLLPEDLPDEVVLWNRLMVAAVALDVAKKALENLRVALPDIYDDDEFAPTLAWLYLGDRYGSPLTQLNSQAEKASSTAQHKISQAGIASSSYSSSSGFGGGFSGGGGGGVGGGGGGGAF